jgi:single-strand DNA-binding protein
LPGSFGRAPPFSERKSNVRNTGNRGRKHRERPETPTGGRTGGDEVSVASNSRRRGADGNWEAGNSLFVTVNCWGRLVSGVGASLGKGSPVIVVGHIYTSEYEDRDGIRRSTLEMRATSVGPDLSRCHAKIEKTVSVGADAASTPAVEGDATDAEAGDDPAPVTDTGLALSA